MRSIELTAGALSASISTHGAWLERLEKNGVPILFPKRTFTLADGTEKIRGGCHVCFPNFGPGGESGLAQHGFARDLEWIITEQQESTATFTLRIVSGPYAGLDLGLSYELNENAVSMRLHVRNVSEAEFRVSPGFHPYFAAPTNVDVAIDDAVYDSNAIGDAVMLSGTPKRMAIGAKDIVMQAENLPQWVLWSDKLDDYICIEPTKAGFSFLQDATLDELLLPAQSKDWALTIRL